MNSSQNIMLKNITLQGFLSFGPDTEPLTLSSLNVLIGPNGSGKSNFVEAFSILRAVPNDLPKPIRQGGGVKDWLWNGEPHIEQATIDLVFQEGVVRKSPDIAVHYKLSFGAQGDRFTVLDELVENESPAPGEKTPYIYFGYNKQGRPMLNVKGQGQGRHLRQENINHTQSILSQRRDPESYPEVTRVADLLHQIVIYRSWSFGPQSPLRSACPADAFTGHLLEDFSNLIARLAVLKRNPKTKQRLIELLQEFSPDFTDLEIVPEGGQLQLYLQDGSRMIPARRLSDGTLRYLCLIAILADPNPPPLVVIEEPELGLHPDILPTIRDLLVDASSRCQLIVSTHSTQLVDAMTDHANSILICEKENGCTQLTRLTQQEITNWREHGGLGHLWMSGHIGGLRW